ncbi:mitochondrial import inner membrane translocase subunit Tim8 B-like protein [Chytriomyces sp. MP71]|nr:mitochondrial import inner membrane translocase subunit Tim8 B-like protein [Chytriomyces sp. MP71]
MDHLSTKEQQEVQAFMAQEQQKAQFQQTVHQFTDTCWDKCVANSKVKNGLDKYDEACMTNCVDRFVDATRVIVGVFNQVAEERRAQLDTINKT